VTLDRLSPGSGLQAFPPPEKWDDWREYDPKQWPRRVEKRYMLVPTICFNCEAACGLLAFVDRETMRVRKFEGNPLHPASRGRNCAKGPATINQIHDPERILKPLKRKGKRGSGEFEEVSWEAALDDIGARIRRALLDGRNEEVMYHVGRPGEAPEHMAERSPAPARGGAGHQGWLSPAVHARRGPAQRRRGCVGAEGGVGRAGEYTPEPHEHRVRPEAPPLALGTRRRAATRTVGRLDRARPGRVARASWPGTRTGSSTTSSALHARGLARARDL